MLTPLRTPPCGLLYNAYERGLGRKPVTGVAFLVSHEHTVEQTAFVRLCGRNVILYLPVPKTVKSAAQRVPRLSARASNLRYDPLLLYHFAGLN